MAQIEAEMLELGEALFDAVLHTASRPAEATGESYPEADLRAAADEFFTALRLLLGLEQVQDAELPARAVGEGHEGRA